MPRPPCKISPAPRGPAPEKCIQRCRSGLPKHPTISDASASRLAMRFFSEVISRLIALEVSAMQEIGADISLQASNGRNVRRLCGNWLVLPSFPRAWVLERDLPIGSIGNFRFGQDAASAAIWVSFPFQEAVFAKASRIRPSSQQSGLGCR